MSKITPLSKIRIAGTPEAPSTYYRIRCPSCYAFIVPGDWKSTTCKCPNCGQMLQTTHDLQGGKYAYLINNARRKGIMWSLFMFFIWEPVKLLDHYLRLRRLLYWAVLRLIV